MRHTNTTLIRASLISATTAAFALAGCETDNGADTSSAAAEVQWTQSETAEVWWLSAWATGEGERWVVGGTPANGSGTIRKYDGSAWSDVNTGLSLPGLNWIHGFSATDIWVAGNAGTVAHMSGETWSLESVPTEEDLWGIWGASLDELWTVGGLKDKPVIMRRDQTGTWTDVTPAIERPSVDAIFKVWGSAADDVWFVGQRGVILHWDGSTFNETGVTGFSKDFIAVWGTSADQVVAVGGRGNGVVAFYDGSEWTARDLAPEPGINGVWMDRDGRLFIGGVFGLVYEFAFGGEAPYKTHELTLETDIHAIFGSPDGSLTAVSGNFNSPSGPYKGEVFVARFK